MFKFWTKYSNSFNRAYFNEYVQIVLNMNNTKVKRTTNQSVEVTAPSMVRGFLLGIDNDYYHLGDTRQRVTHSVKKGMVNIIEIFENTESVVKSPKVPNIKSKSPGDKYDYMLDDVDDSKVN